MKTFFAGFSIGAALGILFAPRSGEEIQDDVRRPVNDFMSKRMTLSTQQFRCST
jgi:gas vesicle protein